jgi:hypothetical protein
LGQLLRADGERSLALQCIFPPESGECILNAARVVKAYPELTYVYGFAGSRHYEQYQIIEHCWVQDSDMVLEVTWCSWDALSGNPTTHTIEKQTYFPVQIYRADDLVICGECVTMRGRSVRRRYTNAAKNAIASAKEVGLSMGLKPHIRNLHILHDEKELFSSRR